MDRARRELVRVLWKARALLLRPGNDFAWSEWPDAVAASSELEDLIASFESDEIPTRQAISILFAPTGSIQEVSISSGWGPDFLALSREFDSALELVYGKPS